MFQTYRRALVGVTLGILLGSGQAIAAVGPAGPTVPAPVSGMPPISLNSPLYVVDVQPGVTPEQIKIAIQTAAEGENMNLVGTLNIQRGLQDRGIKSKDTYVIYEVCNLLLGAKILVSTPEFGAFAPCKIVLFEKKGKLKLMTYLPTYALKYFPKNAEAQKVAQELNKQIIHIMKEAATGGF